MKDTKLRLGVIGVGGRGSIADYAHNPVNGTEIAAGCDINEAHLREFGKKYGAELLTDNYEELLADRSIDAVFVCVPDFLHEQMADAALEAGKAVYLEKPMAITAEGCDRLLETAKRREQKLFVGHNMRHMGFVRKMKELIGSGAIGKVKAAWCRHFVGNGGDFYFKDWHSERRNVTGLLLQKGVHDIDVLHWLCGGYAKKVVGMGGLTLYDQVGDRRSEDEPGTGYGDASPENWPPLAQKKLSPSIDVEDISMMQMELDNGVFCSYQQCHYTPDYWRNYTVIGTEGRIENFDDTGNGTVIKLYNRRTDYNDNGDARFFIPSEDGSHGGADPLIVREFVDYVRNDGNISVSPVAARNAVAVGVMATESLRNGSEPRNVKPVSEGILNYYRLKDEGEK